MHHSGYYSHVFFFIFGTTIPTSFNILMKCFLHFIRATSTVNRTIYISTSEDGTLSQFHSINIESTTYIHSSTIAIDVITKFIFIQWVCSCSPTMLSIRLVYHNMYWWSGRSDSRRTNICAVIDHTPIPSCVDREKLTMRAPFTQPRLS